MNRHGTADFLVRPAEDRLAVPSSRGLENIVDTTAHLAQRSQKARFSRLPGINLDEKGLRQIGQKSISASQADTHSNPLQ
jgi:hypothetical protein